VIQRDYIILDFETGGRDPNTCQLTQIAAIALDGRNFKVKGTFDSEIWAETDDDLAIEKGLSPLEEGALKVTGKNRKDISLAPDIKYVWPKFVDFVKKFNYNNSTFFAPVPCGYNIINYDMVIIDRLCKQFGPYDKKSNKQTLFNQIFKIDLMDIMYSWVESDPDIKSVSMDKMREITGLGKEGAHNALQDVKDISNLLILMMKTQRELYQKLICSRLTDAFADGKLYVN
jgi:exonuclease I